MANFSEAEVTVTLLGKEWTTILAKLTNKMLSPQGQAVYKGAQAKLSAQLLESAKPVKKRGQ